MRLVDVNKYKESDKKRMTKGEQMLINLGYEKHKEMDICEIVFYNSRENSVIRFECDTEFY